MQTSYDAAGRPNGIQSQASGAAAVNCVTNVTYAPHGGINTISFNKVAETITYNSRQKPSSITVANLLALSYFYCVNSGTGCTDNNGNLKSETIVRGSQTWNQSYGYDGVNRLTSASETGPGTGWSQSYGYDSPGNRWLASYPGLAAPTAEVPQSASWYLANNRINGWTYDITH